MVWKLHINESESEMSVKIHIIVLIWSICLGGCISQLKAECPSDARKTVEKFFQFDFEGYRLTSKGHEAIWQLTGENGEPPAVPLAVTKDFSIISTQKHKEGCRLKVQFSVYGHIDELVHEEKFSIEEGDVLVRCKADTCLIDIGPDEFKLWPHPGKVAIDKWLEGLQEMYADTKEDAEGKQKIIKLRKRITSLP